MKKFDQLHPLSAFLYFLAVLIVTVLTMNPVMVLISFLFSLLFGITLFGIRAMIKSLAYSIPMGVMIALINPMFVHKGETILFFLNDNPVTREAVLYGVFAALMLLAVFYWCKCYSEIMTGDKTLFLFGRILPKAGLVLSMAMAFLPKFAQKYREIDEAQKALGIYAGKSYTDRLHSRLRVFSILITASLENSIDTADSMRARGYGIGKRTYYADYRWNFSDFVLSLISAGLGIFILVLMLCGSATFSYYPAITFSVPDIREYAVYISWGLLCGLSAGMEWKEAVLWRYLRSKI